jgi:hypothetical protein
VWRGGVAGVGELRQLRGSRPTTDCGPREARSAPARARRRRRRRADGGDHRTLRPGRIGRLSFGTDMRVVSPAASDLEPGHPRRSPPRSGSTSPARWSGSSARSSCRVPGQPTGDRRRPQGQLQPQRRPGEYHGQRGDRFGAHLSPSSRSRSTCCSRSSCGPGVTERARADCPRHPQSLLDGHESGGDGRGVHRTVVELTGVQEATRSLDERQAEPVGVAPHMNVEVAGGHRALDVKAVRHQSAMSSAARPASGPAGRCARRVSEFLSKVMDSVHYWTRPSCEARMACSANPFAKSDRRSENGSLRCSMRAQRRRWQGSGCCWR